MISLPRPSQSHIYSACRGRVLRVGRWKRKYICINSTFENSNWFFFHLVCIVSIYTIFPLFCLFLFYGRFHIVNVIITSTITHNRTTCIFQVRDAFFYTRSVVHTYICFLFNTIVERVKKYIYHRSVNVYPSSQPRLPPIGERYLGL